MKRRAMRDVSAMTFIEMLVVIVMVVVMATLLLPLLARAKARSPRIACVDNLKKIGTAYRVWEEDHGDLRPSQQPVSKGGWGDFLINADQGVICWTNYAIMANELGQNPKLLVCPADKRIAAVDFATNFKDNTHLSYFVGASANGFFPQSIQGGDRNLGNGPVAARDYGFSPKHGKGNDVAISVSGPVSWSLKMHSSEYAAGAGNILLGDSSAQQVTSLNFNQNWLRNADPTTNWPAGHVPSSPSIRVIFP
jgi:competence protein ComGC